MEGLYGIILAVCQLPMLFLDCDPNSFGSIHAIKTTMSKYILTIITPKNEKIAQKSQNVVLSHLVYAIVFKI
jgi:hypothetical protein